MSDATSRLWNEYGARLHAWFRRRVAQDAEADDLRSETFLRIHDRIGTVRDDERLAPWIFRVAANVWTDHHRARAAATRREVASAVPEVDDTSDDGHLDATVGSWLTARVGDLPEPTREAVRLTELEALSMKEAAARLGISETAAKSRVRRGREALKRDVLACCHLEFDARGHVIETRRRQRPCCED